jgi:hypothetical protein
MKGNVCRPFSSPKKFRVGSGHPVGRCDGYRDQLDARPIFELDVPVLKPVFMRAAGFQRETNAPI